MKITFLTPPEINVQLNAAERTAGCTRLVYDMPNIYVLTIAAILEKMNFEICYADFVLDKKNFQDFEAFAKQDKSDCY